VEDVGGTSLKMVLKEIKNYGKGDKLNYLMFSRIVSL
jgi:hypothetical protein